VSSLDRRGFVRSGVAMAGGALLARVGGRGWLTGATDVRIDVLPAESIGPVTSALYGHFIEHLGGVIYDGVWVGQGSKIPNVRGIRKSIVDDLRMLGPGIVRWPGGCFADSYDWRDGVGPTAQRKRRLTFWSTYLPNSVTGAARYEPNAFGTPEFMLFCKLIGAEPYLAVNARGMTAEDWVGWVEYCNAPAGTTTWADQRVADGARDPYQVRYWGIGNEPWGCGGTLAPEEYAEEYRRFAAWAPKVPGAPDPRLIAAGPNNNDEGWTRRFVEGLHGTAPYGYSIHTYLYPGSDLSFMPAGWYQALANPRTVATTLERQAGILAAGRVPMKLVLDEWGDWYPEPGVAASENPSHLFESIPTLRDALVTTTMFDVFHSHTDVLAVATPAQLVNCIHSLFLADGARCIRTPIYHAHALYQPHIGGAAVRTVVAAERVTFGAEKGAGSGGPSGWVDGVSASATVHESPRRVVVTMTNPRLDQPVTVTLSVRGMGIRAGAVTVLTHADPHAHNTFERPEEVGLSATTPLTMGSATTSDTCTVTLGPASATRVVLVV
jgi:alpha-L-arabinofuranosidase